MRTHFRIPFAFAIWSGMSGIMPTPMQVPGSLAAKAATRMATGRMPLLGEGPTRAEISPEAAQAAILQEVSPGKAQAAMPY